jgi:RNA polymerase sigma-70 factor, ECF subfamily
MAVDMAVDRAVPMAGNRRFEDFEDLVRAHAGAVSAYARAVASDPWTAEDAVQETFLRAWKYLGSYRGDGSFEGWLLRICRNCLIDFANRRAPEPTEAVPERLQAPDTSHELRDLLARLPIEQREVVALCGLLGYEYSDVAQLLDVPVGTVRSRLHRARAVIAEHLVDGDEATA